MTTPALDVTRKVAATFQTPLLHIAEAESVGDAYEMLNDALRLAIETFAEGFGASAADVAESLFEQIRNGEG